MKIIYMFLLQDNLPSLDGSLLNNISESDCESSDSELSSEAPPLPPPRMESLRQQDEDDYDDEESLVSESDSDENESTPPPLPPPRDLDLSKSNEYDTSLIMIKIILNIMNLIFIYFIIVVWRQPIPKTSALRTKLKERQKKPKLWQTN